MNYKNILFFIVWLFCYINTSFADGIDLSFSPIKYEITAWTWSVIERTAKIINNTDKSYFIYTWKSDFTTTGNTWNPKFVRHSELVFPDQQLADWITISTWSFLLPAKEEREISFTIDIPWNATPWWHYWAVFFKKPWDTSDSSNGVSINVDYWVLILLTVSWSVISEWEIEDLVVSGGWSSHINKKIDDCPMWDFTASNNDNKCFDIEFDQNSFLKVFNLGQEKVMTWSIEKNINDEKEDFLIEFDLPFENKWNTHLKPQWKIIILDEDGSEIKWIWKKVIVWDNGVITWEEIVDYLPINDIWWNILPFSKRNFISEWKGFPYKKYDEDWDISIDYWSPWEYYSIKNKEDKRILMPWERELERIVNKNLKAFIDVSYKDENWEDVILNSAKDFEISYTEKYIWLNYYVVVTIWFLWFLIIFWLFLILFKKKYRCIKCNKKIKKDMKICPYCWEKQKHFKKNKKSKSQEQ